MAQHAQHPLRQSASGSLPGWSNPRQERDAWEEQPREIAFWTIPLVLTMIAMAIIVVYFSVFA